jgi:hypothetical protein
MPNRPCRWALTYPSVLCVYLTSFCCATQRASTSKANAHYKLGYCHGSLRFWDDKSPVEMRLKAALQSLAKRKALPIWAKFSTTSCRSCWPWNHSFQNYFLEKYARIGFVKLYPIVRFEKNFFSCVTVNVMEGLLKGKAQYGWPPCTN